MTKPQTFNIPAMRAARFEGFSLADLRKAHAMFIGSPAPESATEAELAKALRTNLNIPEFQEGGPQVHPGERPPGGARPVAVVEKIGKLGRIPNLSSVGQWQGRMRRVQFSRANNPEGTIKLGWDALQRWCIKTPDIVDMPWPYWETVKNCVHTDDRSDNVREWDTDKKTKTLTVTITPVHTPMFSYLDMGDVPGTENLPTSYFEYFQREADKTNVFAGFHRQALIMIYNKLHDTKPSTFFEKKETIDIRLGIATTLGPKFLDRVNEEIYGAEEATA